MIQKLDAVVENGSLKFSSPLPGLSNGQRVRVLIAPVIEQADFAGLSEEAREKLFLQWMDQRSLFEEFDNPPAPAEEVEDFQPLPPGGPLLSEMIIEDRG